MDTEFLTGQKELNNKNLPRFTRQNLEMPCIIKK